MMQTQSAILIFGGRSDEKLVSVASAQNLAASYPFQEHWFIHPTGEISRTSLTELTSHQRPFEIPFQPIEKPFSSSLEGAVEALKGRQVFLGLHGTEGEDGTIQRLFEEKQISFTGCGSRSSADCFDKRRAKAIVQKAGTKTAPGFEFSRLEIQAAGPRLQDLLRSHGRIVIKPAESGSSFGLEILSDLEALPACLKRMSESPYTSFVAEAFVTGRELTVGVIEAGDQPVPLPPSEVILNSGHSFDYQGKYLGRGSLEVTPADLTPSEKKAAGDLAVQAHKALGCYGYTRTDMILTPQGPVFLETNTLPGMTKASFFPQQLQAEGKNLKEFIESQLALALSRETK